MQLSEQQQGSGQWEEGERQRKERMRLEGLCGGKKDPSEKETREGGTEPKRQRERGGRKEGYLILSC